jgi:ABC-2 type transport system permease protein
MSDTAAWWWRVLFAGAKLQMARGRGAAFLVGGVALPIFYTVALVVMGRYLGRTDELAPFLVLGPAVMGVWQNSINTGAAVISDERRAGTLELLVAAPAATELVMLGRVSGSTALSFVALPEALVTARLLGVDLAISDPLVAVAAVLGLGLATMSVTLIFASLFVLTRTTLVFQNAMGFPLFILSGVAFPVALLPAWLQPAASVVALTWVVGLLRSSFGVTSADATGRALLAISILTILYGVIGHFLFVRIERAIRATGSITLAG